MNNTRLNRVSIYSIVLLIVAMFFGMATSFGQVGMNMTKIKDGSVANSEVAASKTSVLELESTNKGFLLPRLTNIQRDAISITDKERGNGLTIYNIDTDCVNYWSKKTNRWLSLCGTLPPATLDITNCNNIVLSSSHGSNTLKQGEYLRDTEAIHLTVHVTQAGTYNISADSGNGYSFYGSGTFTTTGFFTLVLEGLGTPLNKSEGDNIVFTINGKTSTVCNDQLKIKVLSSQLDFVITNGVVDTKNLNWKTYIGVPLNASQNTITLNVDVKNIGFWQVQSTSTINGMTFSGSGEFRNVGVQQIEIVGQGIPQVATGVSSPNIFDFKTNSENNSVPQLRVHVHVLDVDYEMVCNNPLYPIVFRGEFKEEETITRNNAVTIPIKVKAPGAVGKMELLGSLYALNGSTPVKYIAEDVYLTLNSNTDNIQYITFYPEKDISIPTGATSLKFTAMTPNKGTFCGTGMTQEIIKQSVKYGIQCNTVAVFGSYHTNAVPTPNHFINVRVNVENPGNYHIYTNEINGIKFEASGTFTNKGQQVVSLRPTGAFTQGGYYTFSITSDNSTTGSTCAVAINVTDREIVVLTLGSTTYGPDPNKNRNAASAILKNANNFGPNGTVRVSNVRILTTKLQGSALQNFINNNKVDIIFNVIGYNANSSTVPVLVDFVTNKKGVLIIGDENRAHRETKQIIETISGSSLGEASNKYTMINHVVNRSNDPIINGPFGSLVGKHIGNDAHNGWYYSNVTGNLLPLVVKGDGSNMTWGLRHSSLGLAFFGDGGWCLGVLNSTHQSSYPAAFDVNGKPQSKLYDRGTYNVDNSLLYANVMAWAIEYIKANK